MVPHQKLNSSATCHRSHFSHTNTLLFSLWPGLFPLLLVPLSSTFNFSPLSHTVYTPPPFNMRPQILCAFLAQTAVSVSLDSSSPHSKISTSIAHTLNLPCTFTRSGQQSCLMSLCVPTINGYYCSQLDFVVGYNLPSDIVLGDDWACLCQPVLVDGHSMQQPCPLLLDWLLSPHY